MLAFSLGVNEKGSRPLWPKRWKTQNEKTRYGGIRGDRLPVRHTFICLGSSRSSGDDAVCNQRHRHPAKRSARALARPTSQLPPARRMWRLSWRHLLWPRRRLHRPRLWSRQRLPASREALPPLAPPLPQPLGRWKQISSLHAPPRLPPLLLSRFRPTKIRNAVWSPRRVSCYPTPPSLQRCNRSSFAIIWSPASRAD